MLRRIGVIALLLACSPMVARFDTGGANGTVTGVVGLTNATDASVAKIVASSHGVVGLRQQTQPDASGNYALSLPPGEYDLEASAPGYQTVTHANLTVPSATTVNIDRIVLPLVPDTNPPIVSSFTATPFVSAPSVDLLITGEDSAYIGADLSIAVSNAPLDCKQASYIYNFAGCTVTPCRATIAGWALAAGGDGPRTVYACLQNAAGLSTIAPSAVTVTVDSAPPPAALGLAAVANSHQFEVTFGTVTDSVSGVASYAIDYSTDASFATGVQTVIVVPPLSSATIDGITNRTIYYFRVRTRSGAGVETTSATVSSIAGVRGFQLLNQRVTLGDDMPVDLLADDNRLWAVTTMTSGGAHYASLNQCPIGQFDCTQRGSWSPVGDFYIPFSNATVETSINLSRFTHAAPAASGVPAWASSMFMTYTAWDGSSNYYLYLATCKKTNDCTTSANWLSDPLDTGSSNNVIESSPTSLVANARHIFAAYAFDTFPATTSVRLKVCPRNGYCANPSGSSPSYFPAWVTVSPGITLTSNETEGLSAVANEAGYFLAVAPDVTQPSKVVGCLAGSDCTTAGGYFAPVTIAGSGGSQPRMAETPARLYVSSFVYVSTLSMANLVISRCDLATGCRSAANWTTGGTLTTSATTPPFVMHYAEGRLYGVYEDTDARTVTMFYCNQPDTSDCTNPASWQQFSLDSALDDVSHTDQHIAAAMAVFDDVPLIAYRGDTQTLDFRLPQLPSPQDYCVVPEVGGVRGSWTPMTDFDGYWQQYQTNQGANQSFAEPADADQSIALTPPLQAAVNLASTSKGLFGEGSTKFTAAGFREAALTISGALGAPPRVSSVAIGSHLFANYENVAGAIHVTSCTYSSDASFCETASNWSDAVITMPAHTFGSARLFASPTTAYLIGSASGGAWISSCPATSACATPADWSTPGVFLATGSANEAFQLTATGGQVLVASENGGFGFSALQLAACHTEPCTAASTWNSAASGTFSGAQEGDAAFAASSVGTFLFREVGSSLAIYFCATGSDCGGANWAAAGTAYNYVSNSTTTEAGADDATHTLWVMMQEVAVGNNNLPRTLVGHCHFDLAHPATSCNTPNAWSFVSVADAVGGSYPLLHLQVSNSVPYLLFNNGTDINLGTCARNCDQIDHWSIGRLWENNAIAANNTPVFSVNNDSITTLVVPTANGNELDVLFLGQARPN